ncbi:MAG: PTS sugar transporter subunit IIB [Deferribacteraceae bacterium]|jgi:mannose/fructose/N-acetylgalactosamine-specific phosphotransferase system component IIB|nr:PTS sugar transporter subunit IIB [Deferribacteraceae bacterium]
MKKVIFRVDDRLIHGQVIEGWIKNFDITEVIIASDTVVGDAMQQMIYTNVVPPRTKVLFKSVDDFRNSFSITTKRKGYLLVLFNNIKDLLACEGILTDDIYINIGCIASGSRCIEVSDTVFLADEEFRMLTHLTENWKVHIKKLPWERDANLCKR